MPSKVPKTKVIKAKVTKARKKKKRKSKGIINPWEVWSVWGDTGKYTYDAAFPTKQEAEEHIKECHDFLAPVIVQVVIPVAEY